MIEARILVVDDDRDLLNASRMLLKKRFSEIELTDDPRRIPALIAERPFDVVLLDMNFQPGESSGAEGLRWLRRILEIDPDTVVIMITAFSTVDAAVEAMKLGAHDFLEKPWNNEKLFSTLNAAVKLRSAQREAERFRQASRMLSEDSQRRHLPIIGQSEGIRQVLSMVRKAAPTDANVLILGENGTGKELIAREIHALSLRSEEAFVPVDLGAVPGTLMESELFGHRKGAFTDAREHRIGRFQAADRGTFFMDEIGNLPLSLQPKLLAALENREVTPLGGNHPEPVDIRLISATNVPPEQLRSPERFRPDLLYRLNTVEIVLPPLRERADDIPLLANAFVRDYGRKYNRPLQAISEDALSRLVNYSWPGNIRELRYSIERAVILAEGDSLQVRDFASLESEPPAAGHSDRNAPGAAPTDQTLESIERETIRKALRHHRGNISRVARELGLTRASLYRRIEKHGL